MFAREVGFPVLLPNTQVGHLHVDTFIPQQRGNGDCRMPQGSGSSRAKARHLYHADCMTTTSACSTACLCRPLTQVWRRVWGLSPSLWLRRLQQRLHSGCQLPGCECHRLLLCTHNTVVVFLVNLLALHKQMCNHQGLPLFGLW